MSDLIEITADTLELNITEAATEIIEVGFSLPSSIGDVVGLPETITQFSSDLAIAQTAIANVINALATKSDVGHGHEIANIAGLQDAIDSLQTQLSNKADSTHTHADATQTSSGFLSSSDKQKLDGVQAGATANASDAQLRDRSTHTGTQSIATIEGLTTALDGKLNNDDARLSNERTPINNSVSDAKIGDRTVSDASAPASLGPGSLTQWLGWVANRIKAITGKSSWWASPDATLADAATHIANTSNPHGVTTTQIGAATAAQGAKADSALQPSEIGVSIQGYDADLAAIAALTPSNGQFIKFSGAWIAQALQTSDIPNLDAAKITSGIFNNALINWASPGAIGATTPSSIKVTTIDASGTLHTFGATTNAFTAIVVDGSASGNKQYIWRSAGNQRWNFFVNGASTESGGNTGSPVTLSYYNDAGAYAGDIYTANRLGQLSIYASTTFSSSISCKGIASTGTQISITPTSAPVGGTIRSSYTVAAYTAYTSVGPSSNVQVTHGGSGNAVAGIHNSGGSLALQWDSAGGTNQGNVLIGTGTNDGVNKLQVAGSVNATGNATIGGTLKIGSGATITRKLRASTSVNSTIAMGATSSFTITCTGAQVNDTVDVGPPSNLPTAIIPTAFVSAANTVVLNLYNANSIGTLVNGTFTVSVEG